MVYLRVYLLTIYHKRQPHVGKYTSPMDGMGNAGLGLKNSPGDLTCMFS